MHAIAAGGSSPDRHADASSPTLAERLAVFALALRWDDIADAVRHETKRAFLNWLGCAIGGSRHDNIGVVEDALLSVAGPAQSTIIGRCRRTDMLTAALLNCTSSGVHSFDDTHAEIILHPTGPVAAAALALSETVRVSGKDFLLAILLGIEIECRLSRAIAVKPAQCHVGWYLTGITGGIGAAAAASRMLALSATKLVCAMGIASGQAAGNRAMHAAMTSAMVPAHAGQCGLRAALMAQKGFTCSAGFLESPNGFLNIFAQSANAAAIFDGLGQHFELAANTYKPYPCGIVLHPVVDACLQIAREANLQSKNIERIEVHVHPTALVLTNRRHPTNDYEAVVSLHHWVAATIAKGVSGIAINSDLTIQDPLVKCLRDSVEVVADPDLAADAARVRVVGRQGEMAVAIVDHCHGSAARSMSDNDLETKFRDLCRGILDAQRVERLIEACWTIDQSTDAAEVARLAA